MHHNPLVSIITPSYNQGRFIELCMLSIMNQTYKNVEHIIVDGGSNDNTLSVIAKYEGRYNMKWMSGPDSGMYDAINKGFGLAQGDIVAYLNCDDLYLPWTLEIVVYQFRSASIIFGDSIICNERMSDAFLHFTPPFISEYYRSAGVIVQPTVFIKKELFRKIGKFDDHMFKLIADCDYWLRCELRDSKPKKVFEILAIQRDHELTQRITKNERLIGEFKYLRAKYSKANFIELVLYGLLMHLYWRLALLCYRSGFRSWWNMTRQAKITDLSWWRTILEVVYPMPVRKAIRSRQPYIHLNRVIRFHEEK